MKRVSKIMALILVLSLMLCMFAACGTDGTYYLLVNGEKSDTWIKIDGDEYTSSLGTSGSVSVDGDEVTLTTSVLIVSIDTVYIKDGNTLTEQLTGLTYEK